MFLTNTDVTKFSFSLYTQAAALNYHQQKHECCSSTSTAFSTPDVNLEHLRRCKAAVTLPNHKFTAVTQQEAGLPRLGEESCCSRSGCDASHAAGSSSLPKNTYTAPITHQHWAKTQILGGKVGFSLNNQVVGTGPLLAPKILCKKCVFKAVHSILCETHCNSCE